MSRTYNTNGVISDTRLSFKGVQGVAKQAHRDGTRVDKILKRYATLGVDEHNLGAFLSSTAKLPFGISPTVDYQQALNAVIKVESYFASLPSRIRDRFGHNPERMIEFMNDPANLEECQKMGLVAKPEDPKPGSASTPPASGPSSTTTPPSSGKAGTDPKTPS